MRYILQRSTYTDSDGAQPAAEYFDGTHWLPGTSASKSFTYEEAVSRVIVLNMLDRCFCYEVKRCPAGQARASRLVATLDEDIDNALAAA